MENSDSVWGFVGIVVMACGVYALYSFIYMKTQNAIKGAILLGKDVDTKYCKDIPGYIRKVSVPMLVLGVVGTVYGAIDILHCYAYSMPVADTVGMVLFLIVLVVFAVYTTRVKKQYF